MDSKNGESFLGGVVKSMGLVFGDIGTSPIYTLTVVFLFAEPTPANVMGILSLIVWTLIVLVTMGYAWLAMSLGRKGEGGTIVLKEILVRILKGSRPTVFFVVLSYVGVSLLLGDGVITPAISILSAVEGMHLIPGLEYMGQDAVVAIAIVIAIGLFFFQYKGTDRMARAFGPIMAVWFIALTLSGATSIAFSPEILYSISPLNAVNFFKDNGIVSFFVLSEVVLCATGAEALYADMGHLGRKPIIRAWYFVVVALIINYLGQGAYLLRNPDAHNVLFSMVNWEAPIVYIPFLLLTISATVIASQAMISGVFSIIYQGINTRIFPLIKVSYTSSHIKSQIYIGFINWFIMLLVIFIMLVFRGSENLAAAYGLAVTGSMTVTGIMMTVIFASTSKRWKMLAAATITTIDIAYLVACLHKIPYGGYWSLILASIPLLTIAVWVMGQKALYAALKPLDLDVFLVSYEQIYAKKKNIPGVALFFSKDWRVVPRYVIHCIIGRNIIYERNIFISITRTEEPFGLETELTKGIGTNLDAVEVRAGYMEVFNIEEILKGYGIYEKVIFYGVEEIATSRIYWKLFSVIKRLSPNFVQFYNLPPSKLQGVVTRVEM